MSTEKTRVYRVIDSNTRWVFRAQTAQEALVKFLDRSNKPLNFNDSIEISIVPFSEDNIK